MALRLAGMAAVGLYTAYKILTRDTGEPKGDRTTFTPRPSVEFEEARRQPGGSSLQSVLRDFIKMKLGVSGREKHDVLQASRQVAARLTQLLEEAIDPSIFGNLQDPELVGSSSDGTMIQKIGDCDYLLVLIDGGHGVSLDEDQGEGYWRVKITKPSQEMKKLTVTEIVPGMLWNSENHFLSPLKVHAFLVAEVDKVVSQLDKINGILSVRHVSHQAGPALKFRVRYLPSGEEGEGSFDMDFVPCLFLHHGIQLVAKRHPDLPCDHEMTRASRNLPTTLGWRQSFSLLERDHIEPLDKGDGAWSKKVYRLVKYLRYHHPQFRQFSSFIYKTAFLYLLDERKYPAQWRENKLAECFLAFMKKLEAFFREKQMHHYFLLKEMKEQRNLLKPYQDYQIEQFYNFLRRNNSRGQAAWARVFEDIY